MEKTFATALIAAATLAAQSPAPAASDGPKFEFADVHVAPKTQNAYMRSSPPRGGRYELHTASMLDLIRVAWTFDNDKILGGPSWLEMTRYDVVAKVPNDATLETVAPMLQTLLAERFKLAVHKETKPLPTYVLTAGKKPSMKPGDGTGETGCRPRADNSTPVPGDGVSRLSMIGADGKATTITLGPGQTVQYICRNVTMESFVVAMRSMIGAGLGTNPVLDQTNLQGKWDFDVKYSLGLIGPMASGGDRISFPEAVDKQLGLKLEERPNPTPVLIVDSADEKPAANPPGTAEALPPIVLPTEFEVIDIKLSDPAALGGRYGMQPGGRFSLAGLGLAFLVQRAFNTYTADQIIGMPKSDARYEITAKAKVDPGANLNDPDLMSPLMISLLKERFGLKYHTEERPLTAYSLVSVKPKMKKADPASRTSCKRANGPAGSPPGTVALTCQNMAMGQFVDQLRGIAQNMNIPPLDATELEGGWDFTLTWNQRAGMNFGPAQTVGVGGGGAEGNPAASDPTGGYTIFEAIEKQLGLKLEMQKRPVTVYVIDHLDEKPTDN